MLDYFLLRRAIKQALAETSINIKMVPFGHLLTIPAWSNSVKGPNAGFYWKILNGLTHHETLTETQVYVGPKQLPLSAYVQIAVMLAADPTGDQNYFPIGTFSTSGTFPPAFSEIILDDTMMITHKGAAGSYTRALVWEWEASKVYRL